MGRKVSIDIDGEIIYESDEDGMVELEEWTEALSDKDPGENDD